MNHGQEQEGKEEVIFTRDHYGTPGEGKRSASCTPVGDLERERQEEEIRAEAQREEEHAAQNEARAREAERRWSAALESFSERIFRQGFSQGYKDTTAPGEHRCSCFECATRARTIENAAWSWFKEHRYPLWVAQAQKG